jgi:hypothetical protein
MDFMSPRRGKNDDQLRELVEYILSVVRKESTPLHATMTRLAQELHVAQTSLVALEHRLDAQRDQLPRIAEHLGRLDHELTAVYQQHDELDARFTKVLAAQAGVGTAGASARHIEHQEIADRYRTFVDQELTSAGRVVSESRRRKRTDDGYAHDVRELSVALFAGAEIEQRLLGDLLKSRPEWATRLAVGGTELRMLAGAALPEGSWDFEIRQRGTLDPATQRPWADYAPDAPLDFVVAPAYLVGNRVFERQRVATERHTKQ